jgi:cell wall-associated NlpC family hydrolase
MYRWNTTVWMIITAITALCVVFSSFSLHAALKFKKKTAKRTTSIRHRSSYKYKSKSKRLYHGHRHHRRHYYSSCNITAGRIQALAFLQSSKELATLAGVEYRPDADLQQFIDNDGEEILGNLYYEGISGSSYDEEDVEDDMSEAFSADVNSFEKLWVSYMKGVDNTNEVAPDDENTTHAGLHKQDLMSGVMDWIGTPYFYGGTQRSGIDCSAFTGAVYRAIAQVTLPRTAARQSAVGEPLREGDKLQFGDLVFFHTRRGVYVSHVGMYLGDNLFAHASCRFGVTVSSLTADYYRTHFIGARRLRVEDVEALHSNGLSSIAPVKDMINASSYAQARD